MSRTAVVMSVMRSPSMMRTEVGTGRRRRWGVMTGIAVVPATEHVVDHAFDDSVANRLPEVSRLDNFDIGTGKSSERGCRNHGGTEQHDTGEKSGADVLRFHG